MMARFLAVLDLVYGHGVTATANVEITTNTDRPTMKTVREAEAIAVKRGGAQNAVLVNIIRLED